jgi:hypothetical protein
MKRIKSRRRYSIELATVAVVTASLIVACGRNVNNGGFRPRKNGTSTLGIYPGKPGPGSFATLSPEQKSLRLRQIIAKVLLGKSEAEVNDLEELNRLLPESAADIILGVSAELGKAGSSVDPQRGQTDPASVVARESLLRSNISAVIGPESQAKSVVVSGEFQPDKTYLKIEEGGVEFRAACYEGCENFVVFISSGEAKAGFIFKINNETGSGQIVASTLGSRLRTFEDAKKLLAAGEGVARTIVDPPIPSVSGDTVVPPAVVEGSNTGDSTHEISPTGDSAGDQAPPTGEMGPPPPTDDKAGTPPPPPTDDKAGAPPAPPTDDKAGTPPAPPTDDKAGTPTPVSAKKAEVEPVALSASPAAASVRKKYDAVYPTSGPGVPENEKPETAAQPKAKPADLSDFAPAKVKPPFIVSETWDKMKALTRQGIQAIIASIPKSEMGGDFDQSLVVYTSLIGSDPSKLSSENKKDLLELFQKHYHDTFALRIPYFQISLDRTSKPATLGVDLAISGNGLDLKKRSDEGMNVALEDEILKGKTMTMDIKDVNGSSDDVRISMRCISNCKEVVAEIWFGENSESNSFTLRSAGLYKFAETSGKGDAMNLIYSTSGSSWTSRRFDSLINFETIANDCVAKVAKVKDCPAATEPAGSKVLDSAKLCEIDNAQLLRQKEICSKGFKDSVSAGFLEIYKGLAKNRGTESAQKKLVPPSVPAADSKPEVAPRQTSPPKATTPQSTKRVAPRRPQSHRSGDLRAGQGRRVPPRIAKSK